MSFVVDYISSKLFNRIRANTKEVIPHGMVLEKWLFSILELGA